MMLKYNTKLLLKQVNNLLRLVILTLIYLIRIFHRQIKKLFLFEQLPIAVMIIIFSLFSYFEIQTVYKNSSGSSLLAKIGAEENVFIETGPPVLNEQKSEKKQGDDFKIAAFREEFDKKEDEEEEEYDENQEIALTLGGSTLMAPETNFNALTPSTRTEIEKYIVQPGDTISTIAEQFGLKWSTLLWENNLNYWSIIQPGNELKILPVDGLTHKIKKGETLSFIAQRYKASLENITKFNGLDENSTLELGRILIIPDGTPPPPPQPVLQTEPIFVQENYSNYSDWRKNTECHKFFIRQCTDWVAFKWATEQGQCVPAWGDAKNWFNKAKKSGYATGNQPAKGAIIVLTCTSWICQRYGHIGYVENFNANTVTFSEMNGLERRAYSEASLKNATNEWQNGWKILGYIYP